MGQQCCKLHMRCCGVRIADSSGIKLFQHGKTACQKCSIIHRLHEYSNLGHSNSTQCLADCGHVDISGADDLGQTAFHHAAVEGDIDSLQQIYTVNGVDINVRDRKQQTPLHLAAESGNFEAVKWLCVQQKVDINAQNKYGETPLFLAVSAGRMDIVEFLCRQRNMNVNITDRGGWTPLLQACLKGQKDVVECLSQLKDVDINMAAEDGFTPIHTAAAFGHTDIVVYLIEERGVDINMRFKDSLSTPLHLAVENEQEHTVKWLCEQEKVDVNAGDKRGTTPLHQAAADGSTHLIQHLIDSGRLDLCATDKYGNSALHHFCMKHRYASPSISDSHGSFDWLPSNLHCAQFLIDSGCEVNKQNKKGETPLYISIEMGSDKLLTLLLIEGADGNITAGCKEQTTLSQLRRSDFSTPDNIKMLILSGYKLNSHDINTELPIIKENEPELFCWLRNHIDHPPSLKHLSRLEIRKLWTRNRNGMNIHDRLREIGMAEDLSQYVTFMDFYYPENDYRSCCGSDESDVE